MTCDDAEDGAPGLLTTADPSRNAASFQNLQGALLQAKDINLGNSLENDRSFAICYPRELMYSCATTYWQFQVPLERYRSKFRLSRYPLRHLS